MPKISQLPPVEAITTGSIIPVVENGITQKLSVGKLYEFLSGALDETFATETELMITASAGSVNTSSLVTTSSFNAYTASVVSVNTSSLVTTGSNRFNGNQIITGSVDLTGFPLTASFIRLNGGNGSSNEDNFHQIRFDYRYDSGSRDLGAGGFSHFLTSRHFPGANSNNNALDVYLNNSVGQYTSTAWNTGSTLGVTITATGIGVLKTNPNTALDVSGNLLVTGSIISTTSPIISSSTQITNFGFATTTSVEVSTLSLSNRLDLPVYLSSSTFNSFSSSVNTFTASVNGKTGSYATTGSNQFNGNQSVTGSLIVSGGFEVKNSGYSWSFESNGRTKIPNITFNSDRGTGMVGIKPAIGIEFQIETSTAESSVGPWSFGLDGTLSAPAGANITRVANLITTSSFNTFTSSVNSTTQSLNNFSASVNGKTGSYATTGSNTFTGTQTLNASFVQGLFGGAGATGVSAHAQGYYTEARGEYSHAEGLTTLASGTCSHAEGTNGTAGGSFSHAEGNYTQANGAYSHAEGNNTQALGVGAHSEGNYTIAKGNYQHVQGQYNITSSAQSAFIIGNGTDFDNRSNLVFASGSQFQITGSLTVNGNQTITGSLNHGLYNTAAGENSHAEGDSTQAIGNFSHAEGLGTIAYGGRSHAEGQDTIASGSYSHAEGYQTIALADHQHVQGQYNITSSVPAAFIVGNGTDDSNRSNLIHAAGNTVEITGSLSVSGSLMISGSGSLNGSNIVSSNTIQKIETISSASYAALTPPVSGTLYIII
jgi:hypothetical protein